MDLEQAIYANMQHAEMRIQPMPAGHYDRCRKTLTSWVIEVCEEISVSDITAFHACSLMDRVFVSGELNNKEKQEHFQLFAMCCILIAAKYQEVEERHPTMAELIRCAGDTYSTDWFRQAEFSVLRFLKWDVSCVTPACYTNLFLHRTLTGDVELDHLIHENVALLLGLALQNGVSLILKPSLLCAAAFFTSRFILRWIDGHTDLPIWDDNLTNVTHYNENDLKEVHEKLLALHQEFDQTQDDVGDVTMNDDGNGARTVPTPNSPPSPTSMSCA